MFRARQWQFHVGLTSAIFLGGLGLGTQEAAYRLASSSNSPWVEPLFFSGLVVMVVPLAAVLVQSDTQRRSRIASALVLSELLFISKWLSSPLIFDSFDSLLHLTSLWQLVDHQRFFTQNTLLPVSAYYPGLEMVTAGAHWLTGLPTLPAQLVTLLLARGLLIVSLYLVFERITRSGRAAGMAIALYVANPEFYNFDAQYAYETLALTWAALGANYLLRTLDERTAKSRRILRPAVGVVAALAMLAITHHVTSWIVVVGLMLILVRFIWLHDKRATIITLGFICFDVLVVGLWTLFVGSRISGYLGPLIQQALSSVGGILTGQQHTKSLFVQPSGAGTPGWERALILVSVLLWVLLITTATLSKPARAARRRSRALALLSLCSLVYFVVMAVRLSPAATEFGNRAAAVVSVPVACVVAVWWASSSAAGRARNVAASLTIFSLLMVGGVALGTGSYHQRYPGPYLVEADQRSIPGPSLDAARWAGAHLPVGTRIGADRDNSAIMAAVGHLSPVTQASGSVNVGQLFFAPSIGNGQIQEIRNGKIRLLLVDHRLAAAAPYVGVYFEPGETSGFRKARGATERLTSTDIDKFDSWPSAVLIHRQGPIAIYDLSKVLGLPPVPVSRIPRPSGDLAATNWWVLASALLLSCLWLVTERKRRPHQSDGAAAAVATGMAILVVFAIIACLVVATPGSPRYLVLPFLGIVALLMVASRRPRQLFRRGRGRRRAPRRRGWHRLVHIHRYPVNGDARRMA